MFALVLGGPAAVESLMDVVGRSPASTVLFSPMSVHPTPYLRVLINLILLKRLGFNQMASELARVWQRLYPRIGQRHSTSIHENLLPCCRNDGGHDGFPAVSAVWQ
jgi:hypothetical protein